MAVLGDDDEVLDPDAEAAGDVDAGLDRDDVAGAEHVVGALAEARRLVDLEADAVAEAVAELVAVAAVADDRPRDLVGGGSRHAGADRLQRLALGVADELVDLARLALDLADGERPRAIRAVAVDLRAHVEDDEVPGADLALGRQRVGKRAVLPRRRRSP